MPQRTAHSDQTRPSIDSDSVSEADEARESVEEEEARVSSSSSSKSPVSGDSVSMGVVEVAYWSICGLFIALIPTMIALFSLARSTPAASETTQLHHLSSAATASLVLFITFRSFSFLGRWTYDLAVTQLTQMWIPPARRSDLGGCEQAIVSAVSMVHWVAAAVWHRQEDFQWLALGSFVSVGGAALANLYWTRWRIIRVPEPRMWCNRIERVFAFVCFS